MENLINLWWDLNTTFPGESASIMWKLGYIVDVHNDRFYPYSFSKAQDHCFLFPEIGRSFHSHYNWLPSLFCGSPDMFCSCFSSILGRATRPPFNFLQATRGGPSFFIPLIIRRGHRGIIVDWWGMDEIFVLLPISLPLRLLIFLQDALYKVHGSETPVRKNLLLYVILLRCIVIGCHRSISLSYPNDLPSTQPIDSAREAY